MVPFLVFIPFQAVSLDVGYPSIVITPQSSDLNLVLECVPVGCLQLLERTFQLRVREIECVVGGGRQRRSEGVEEDERRQHDDEK